MGKRTKDKTDEEIKKKIRRLEEELRDRENVQTTNNNRQPEDREDYDYYSSLYNFNEELELDAYGTASVGGHSDEEYILECHPAGTHLLEAESERRPEDVPDTAAEPGDGRSQQPPSERQVPESNLKSVVTEVEPNTSTTQNKEDSLPTEILAILGEAKRSSETFGKKIPCDISERWGQILLEGLAKEQKESLLSKSLIPENFQLAKAPKLNLEVASVITDPAKNRDKRLEKMQNQLGSGISGIVDLTADLICKYMNKIDIIKKLSEINQILLDLHYEETMNRRRLIIPMLDKKFINIIQGVKRDELLFGNKLGENIKTSKSIEQSSLQIKKPVLPQPSTSRKTNGPQGNSRAPPRMGGGAAATRAPAPYRYSSYPPPPAPAARRAPPRRPPPPPPPSSSRSHDRRSRR